MPITAIVGINWGDEGKGRMVDLMAEQYDVVVRYQGGNNAGHTVVNQYGKFALNLIPSGIFHPNVLNIIGNGCVIDIEHLANEIEKLSSQGVTITPKNLMISERAHVCFPYHRMQDVLEETRLADAQYGSTRRGIGPVYGDKYLKKGLQVGELLLGEAYLYERLKGIVEWKNLTIHGVYGAEPVKLPDMVAWAMNYGAQIGKYIGDTQTALAEAQDAGKSIMFEAQLGALRDLDFGIYPFTSSSNPLAAYAPIGAGLPGARLEDVLGIVKAYSTCVGEGPFVVEMQGEEAERLRENGGEYGAATGRPRRVGALDLVATRYGVKVQGATRLALTKLDVLSYLDEISICTAYEIDGTMTTDFPFTALLNRAKPIFITVPGWKQDISKARTFEELPKAAQDYVLYIEKQLNCFIEYVSVGAAREEIIRRTQHV